MLVVGVWPWLLPKRGILGIAHVDIQQMPIGTTGLSGTVQDPGFGSPDCRRVWATDGYFHLPRRRGQLPLALFKGHLRVLRLSRGRRQRSLEECPQ